MIVKVVIIRRRGWKSVREKRRYSQMIQQPSSVAQTGIVDARGSDSNKRRQCLVMKMDGFACREKRFELGQINTQLDAHGRTSRLPRGDHARASDIGCFSPFYPTTILLEDESSWYTAYPNP